MERGEWGATFLHKMECRPLRGLVLDMSKFHKENGLLTEAREKGGGGQGEEIFWRTDVVDRCLYRRAGAIVATIR